jgi:hypothetical protein
LTTFFERPIQAVEQNKWSDRLLAEIVHLTTSAKQAVQASGQTKQAVKEGAAYHVRVAEARHGVHLQQQQLLPHLRVRCFRTSSQGPGCGRVCGLRVGCSGLCKQLLPCFDCDTRLHRRLYRWECRLGHPRQGRAERMLAKTWRGWTGSGRCSDSL